MEVLLSGLGIVLIPMCAFGLKTKHTSQEKKFLVGAIGASIGVLVIHHQAARQAFDYLVSFFVIIGSLTILYFVGNGVLAVLEYLYRKLTGTATDDRSRKVDHVIFEVILMGKTTRAERIESLGYFILLTVITMIGWMLCASMPILTIFGKIGKQIGRCVRFVGQFVVHLFPQEYMQSEKG